MVKKYRDVVKDPILAVQWNGNHVSELYDFIGSSMYMKGNVPVVIEKMSDVQCNIGDYILKFPGEDGFIVANKDGFEELFEEIKE